MLADEPTGNLDTKTSDAVLEMLVRSNRELGQTTLMITHNPEAAAIAGRILYMRDGEIVKEEAGNGHHRTGAAPAISLSRSGSCTTAAALPFTVRMTGRLVSHRHRMNSAEWLRNAVMGWMSLAMSINAVSLR